MHRGEPRMRSQLPDDFCPINDPLPEGWWAPVTILPVGYFDKGQMELFKECGGGV